MTAAPTSGDLQGARFFDANLRGARFVESDLSGTVMRGVDIADADIDAPWLFEGDSALRVNGIDVVPYVDAELNRRFPGRVQRNAADPDGLRSAWAAVQGTWAKTLDRVAAMPAGTVDISIDGEWSFAQTLRHLVLATDVWLGKAILGVDQPFHPVGLRDSSMTDEGDGPPGPAADPSYDEVLEARAGRVAMVGDFLAQVGERQLAEPRDNPHGNGYPETVRRCLHTILEEEWEHLRFATRDLDAIEAGSGR